jgi:hypothetical protein
VHEKKPNCHVCNDTGVQALFTSTVPCDWCILGGSKKSRDSQSVAAKTIGGVVVWHVPDDGSTWHMIPLCTGNTYHMIQYPVPSVGAQVRWDKDRTLVYVMDENGSHGHLAWYETGSPRARAKMDAWVGDGTLRKYAFTVCRAHGSTKYTNNAFKLDPGQVHPSVLLDAIHAWSNR